jgi:hypothetical protein
MAHRCRKSRTEDEDEIDELLRSYHKDENKKRHSMLARFVCHVRNRRLQTEDSGTRRRLSETVPFHPSSTTT